MTVCVGSFCNGSEDAGGVSGTEFIAVADAGALGVRLALQLGPVCVSGYYAMLANIDAVGYTRARTEIIASLGRIVRPVP